MKNGIESVISQQRLSASPKESKGVVKSMQNHQQHQRAVQTDPVFSIHERQTSDRSSIYCRDERLLRQSSAVKKC
jgi:hypothetical protein